MLRGIAEGIDLFLLCIAFFMIGLIIQDDLIWMIMPLMALYFVTSESLAGQTIGKKLFSLRVVNEEGEHPSVVQATIRNVLRPLEGFGVIGVAIAGSTRRGQRLGDLLARTYVVIDNELEQLSKSEKAITENELPSSREIVSLTANGIALAKAIIQTEFNPSETGLCLIEDRDAPTGFAVKFDLIDVDDEAWHWTSDGVTIIVPHTLAERCEGLVVDDSGGTLIVTGESS
ncbi:MAG: RDD family protein [Planctomycetaceae bacterium]|nr:RDD family protein [Planctomycetaceae bacterium]MCA9043774.1 RDD family protein [Planctomycetaceae bacterium]